MVAPKNIDPQKVIAEVIARFPAARDFDLTHMVERALAWEEVKRNQVTPRSKPLFEYGPIFSGKKGRDGQRITLLTLFAQSLTEPIDAGELVLALKQYSTTKGDKEALLEMYDISGEHAVLTDYGRKLILDWKDKVTRTGLIRTAAASPRVLDLNGPIAPYLDNAEKSVSSIYRNWPARLEPKGSLTKLIQLLSERSYAPYLFKGKNTVAAGSYLVPIDVYQKLRGNRVDLFDPACDRVFGSNRTGKDAEDQLNLVSPTEAEIEAALAFDPLPIRGVTRSEFSVDIGIPGKGLSTTIVYLLKKAGYTRFRLYWLDKHQMILIVDANTGKKLMTAMFMRLD